MQCLTRGCFLGTRVCLCSPTRSVLLIRAVKETPLMQYVIDEQPCVKCGMPIQWNQQAAKHECWNWECENYAS